MKREEVWRELGFRPEVHVLGETVEVRWMPLGGGARDLIESVKERWAARGWTVGTFIEPVHFRRGPRKGQLKEPGEMWLHAGHAERIEWVSEYLLHRFNLVGSHYITQHGFDGVPSPERERVYGEWSYADEVEPFIAVYDGQFLGYVSASAWVNYFVSGRPSDPDEVNLSAVVQGGRVMNEDFRKVIRWWQEKGVLYRLKPHSGECGI